MAAFGPEVLVDGGADRAFRLAQNGFVTLYHRTPVLDADVRWFESHGYAVAPAQSHLWRDARDLHDDLVVALSLPGYYGRNLDALSDCLGDLATRPAGPDAPRGDVLVLRGFDAFVRRDPVLARALLDVVAGAARRTLLLGHLLLCLVQSDDPDLSLPAVGAQRVAWNPAEWTAASRRR